MKEENIVPVLIASISPFRLIKRDKHDRWDPSTDELNSRSYDYVKLNRLSTFVEADLPKPFSMAVSFDGCLLLPALPEFKERQKALDVFNKVLGKMLLGGLYFEAVSPTDITFGRLHFNGYFSGQSGLGENAKFRTAIRTKHVGNLDVIRLWNPPILMVNEIHDALRKGKEIVNVIPNLSLPILLNGTTYLVNNQWSESLTSIWTSIEQVVSHIWEDQILNKITESENISGRKEFLKDYRTWSISTKIELLFQKKLIDKNTYQLLNLARKSRNDFVHKGVNPTKPHAHSAIEGLFRLISKVSSNYKKTSTLLSLLKIFKSHDQLNKKPKKVYKINEVSHWLPLPPIPGSKEWGDKPYEIIEEIQLKPI